MAIDDDASGPVWRGACNDRPGRDNVGPMEKNPRERQPLLSLPDNI